MRNLQETFTYDNQNRLTGVWLGSVQTGTSAYDGYGRMTTKTADSQAVFSNAVYSTTAKPHAMDAAETLSGVFPSQQQNISYTCFDKVSQIMQGNNSLNYTYGYDHQRIFMEEHVGNSVRTKRYVGNCEYVTETSGNTTTQKWLTYLTGPTGVYAVVVTENNANTIHYILKDNLGSWTTIASGTGTVEQRLSYDAWGNLRNPNTWTGDFIGTPMFDRGYTGHEHLYSFGLINMNGRMYDPVMSCFLSVDQYVQSPENAQGFNRYAYCMNNPLRYVDPSGWTKVNQAVGYTPNSFSNANDPYAYCRRPLEPRDLGILQLPQSELNGTWMEGNERHGGGGGSIGGFYDEKGHYLGTLANINGKVYVIRSENKETKKMRRQIRRFFRGEGSSITEETIFQYFIEIEPSQTNRQRMFEIVSQDDGTGGTSPNNNREYGGYIDNGVVKPVSPGPVENPQLKSFNYIELPMGYSTFHSHSSGFVIERDRTDVNNYWWEQPPSDPDILNSGDYTHYVFGRWNNHVYIYNINGVQTIMRTNNFINIGL